MLCGMGGGLKWQSDDRSHEMKKGLPFWKPFFSGGAGRDRTDGLMNAMRDKGVPVSYWNPLTI